MTTLVFTICARNYVGLAKVLQQSVARHGPGIDFRIYVAEDSDEDESGSLVFAGAALTSFIDPTEYANMAFAYNVTEFCTALKAACFMHGFKDGYDRCIYMDPDIFVCASIDHIVRALDKCTILITPHLCVPSLEDGPRADSGILATGVYNLGFLALRRSADADNFLKWWHQRLRYQAFNDHYNALYTDQRWIDFVPSLFPGDAVLIWRHLGCNVAPWNYHERRIDEEEGIFVVRPRSSGAVDPEQTWPLVFLHFSGFDFRRIVNGTFAQINLAGADSHTDIEPVYALYGDAIRALATEMRRSLALPYGFDSFADGSPILPSHRRLFRIWRQRHGDATDPFAVGAGSFHAALAARRLLARDTAADVAADKASARSIDNPGRLLARAHLAFRLLYRLAGRARFFFLVRSLNRLSHVEQHYDTFRLDALSVDRAVEQPADPR